MNASLKISCLAVAIMFGGACEQVEDDQIAYRNSEVLVDNTDLLNSTLFNGVYLNGVYLNGVYLNGVYLNGVYLNGVYLNGVYLNGTRASDGVAVQGNDFVGAQLKAQLSDSTQIDLKINSITHDNGYNVDWYNISVSFNGGTTWGPLCTGGVGALPLSGRWGQHGQMISDSTMITFACDNAALAKCRKWGYDPASTREECDGLGNCKQQPLKAWHEACTRMVRADYCGDGFAHTRNGTAIDLYDNLSIQTRAGGLQYLEADWGVNGAYCVRHTRYTLAGEPINGETSDLQYIQTVCPSRLAANDSSCGADPNSSGATDLTSYPSSRGYDVSLITRHLLRNDSNIGQ